MRYKPVSIKDTGLPIYLDGTRDKHNGLGWSDFKQRMELEVPKSRIARDFGMSTQGIWRWVSIFKEMDLDQS